ncbi:MAG: mechanosensitive ion channel family protein, partial [Firmicutes bacterium]|nr:mechanosensitive ion channel family protein [Bacillota bacterium]
MEDFKRQAIELATTYGGKILLALIVLIVGLFVIKALKKLADKAIDRTKLDETVKVLAKKVVQALLYVILIISVIEILGVSMS